MSRRPFDPRELDQAVEGAGAAISELDRYVTATAADVPRGLKDQVLVALEGEPTPRRGPIAWLLTPAATTGRLHRFARAAVVAGTLVLAVAGAMFAGELAGLVQGIGRDATPIQSPSLTETARPTPSPTLDERPSVTPPASDDANASAEEHGSPEATANETGEGSRDNTANETPGETPAGITSESP